MKILKWKYKFQWVHVAEFVMIVGAIVGSTMLAANADFSKWGYTFFTISSMAGIYVGIIRKTNSLTLLNGYFTIVNIAGVYRWLF